MSLEPQEGKKPARRAAQEAQKVQRSDAVEITRMICQTVGGIALGTGGIYLIMNRQTQPGWLTLGAAIFALVPDFFTEKVQKVVTAMIAGAVKEVLKGKPPEE